MLNDPLSVILKLWLRIGTKWLSLNYVLQCTALLALVILKSSIGIETTNIRDAYLPASISIPQPEGYFSASLGNLVIAKILGIETVNSWIKLHIFLLTGSLFYVAWLSHRVKILPPGILILFIATSPITGNLFSTIGKYDVITFLGAVIIGIMVNKSSMFIGTLLMLLGNPEQAVVALICLLILSEIGVFQLPKYRIKLCLAFSLFFTAAIQIWMISNSVVSNRFTMLPLWLSSSLANFMNSPFNHIWSWYGPFWLLILVAILNIRGSYRNRLIMALVVVPGLTTIVTLDGLRVFGLVVLPSLLVCCVWIIKEFDDNFEKLKKFIGLFLLLWVLTPTSSGGGLLWGYISMLARNEFQQLSSLAIEIGQRFS